MMQETGGSLARDGVPVKLAAKGMWGPEKGTGDLEKSLSCTLATGRGPGGMCRGIVHPAACSREAAHGGYMETLVFCPAVQTCLGLNLLIEVLSFAK